MDGRGDSTASITVRRRKGASILIFKKFNQAIRRSRTDRVRGIFKAFKALRKGPPGFKSGRREVKYSNSNSWRKVPNSGMEPDYNVEVEYFGEDEDDDEDGDEYWCKEDENDWFPPYMFKKCYRHFNASGKRPYLVWFEKKEYEVQEMIELIQKALDCSTVSHARKCFVRSRDKCMVSVYASEEETDSITGLDEVLYVEPC